MNKDATTLPKILVLSRVSEPHNPAPGRTCSTVAHAGGAKASVRKEPPARVSNNVW